MRSPVPHLVLLSALAMISAACSDQQVPPAYMFKNDAWAYVNDCMPFAPCESDISGAWDVTCGGLHYNNLFNSYTSVCPNAVVNPDVAVTGTMSFVPSDPQNPGGGDYTYAL